MDVMGDLVRRRAREAPDHPAITVADEVRTYGDLDHRSDRVARALLGAGVAPGDHAAVVLPNGSAFVDVWMGMAKAGVVEVPLHTASRGEGLRHAMTLTGARLAVVHAPLLDRLVGVADDLPALRTIVVVPGDDPVRLPRTAGHAEVVDLASLLAAAPDRAALPVVAPTDPSSVLFTSGTTGPSKGVVLSHRANFRLARTTSTAAGLRSGDVLLTTFPLFHVAARYVSTLGAMLIGGRVVIRERFSASRFWEECRTEGVTAIHYLGSLLTILLAQPEQAGDRDHPVRLGYGAGGPGPVADAFTARFGVPLWELYGMTETGAVTMNTRGAHRPGTCGRPLPDCVVEVHDADDRPVPPGVVGEICVRPREPSIMIERYIGMPAETVTAFRNLWFHTGDRGWVDEDGFLHFDGRQKDAIRRRGENVSAFEVEVVIDRHPDVAGSAVVGVADPISGEEVLAWVEPRAGARLDPADLIAHCARHLPYFAVPRYLAQVDQLPRNTSQRVEKHRLPADGAGDAWDREAAGIDLSR